MADMSWDDILTEELINEVDTAPTGPIATAPIGKHQVVVTKAEAGYSGTGTQQIELTLKVVGGEHDGCYATTWPHRMYKSDKAMKYLLQQLKSLGVTVDVIREHKPTMGQIAAILTDRRATVETRQAVDWQTKEKKFKNDDVTPVIEVNFALRSPAEPNEPVTEFPAIEEPADDGFGQGPAPF